MTNQTLARAPRRLSRPRWMDPRVIAGILLVIASVVVGSRVIAASSQTTPLWAATRAISVGTVLAAGDLEPVDVNLGATGTRYVGMGSDPVGRVVNVAVGPGELIP